MTRFCDKSKDWMDLPRYGKEYIDGVISFLDFAYSEGEPDGGLIQCPYKRCCNINWYRRDVVFDHLVVDGFVKGYRTWINHEEWTIPIVVDDEADDKDGARNDLVNIQSISEKNKQHTRQKNFPHRMGPINFARVQAALREGKGTNEEPKRFEMSIATRTNRKRKELDEATQYAIEDFQSRQASGETEEEAFPSLFGKEQPGRVRCYRRSITQTDLRRHAEVAAIKQQHQEEISALQSLLGDVQTRQQQQAKEIHGLWKIVKLLLLRSEPGMRPEEVEVLLQDAQHPPVDANSAHGSTHVPNIGVDNVGDINED